MHDIDEAWTRYVRQDFAGAAALSRLLLAADPNDPAALTCGAMSDWQRGIDVDHCVADLRRATALAPDNAAIRRNLATVLASIGALDEACASYDAAIQLRPDDMEAFYGLSQACRFTEETPLVQQVLKSYASGLLPDRAREYACFALAKVYSDLGRHKRAIHFCVEGNWLAQRTYDAERPRRDLAELRAMADAGTLQRLRTRASREVAGPAPLFIVGMPRSGATLVETILAQHPDVHAGGETQGLPQAETALLDWSHRNRGHAGGRHEMLEAIPPAHFARLASAVRQQASVVATGRPFSTYTDKLPENALRLGLISLLFPNARVIYLRRNPLDCCVSNFFLDFVSGNGFAFQQSLLGERCRQVAESMQIWKEALDLPILDVSYEALVTQPELMIRRIVAFAGLEWNDACLRSEPPGRRVVTANPWQVRQPFNAGSIGRWRHYGEWIQPLVKALGGMDWIDAETNGRAGMAA